MYISGVFTVCRKVSIGPGGNMFILNGRPGYQDFSLGVRTPERPGPSYMYGYVRSIRILKEAILRHRH